MKTFHLSLVLCILSFCSSAAPFAADVTCARFPDADVVTVDEIERVKYNPDGTYEQTDEYWTKILTEKGRREESSFSLDYSKRYGEAAVVFVKAIGTNGVERTIDVSATTKESTDNSSMSVNIYDPLDRKIVCTIPGLKVGEVVHVKTMRKATKARCRDKWADLSVMEWSHPIVKSTYEVTAPAARPLKKIAIRHPLGNVVTNVTRLADGSLVHTFTSTNSAQVFPEPDMPPLYTQVQNVRVSTAESWPEISKWYWNLCAPHLAKTNAAMLAKVREILATSSPSHSVTSQPCDLATSSLRNLFRFVSQEVRYMGLTMEDTSPGYAPHDVDVTFDNRYGVCRDKAGLLVAMLRLAGFKAFPVLIHVGAKLDPEVPQPFFNHAIVAVEVAKCDGDEPHHLDTSSPRHYLLMDPTNENTKDLFPSYLGNCSYLVARPEGESLMTSPVDSPEHNAMDLVSSAVLARDGSMFFESEISPKGINDTAYRGVLVKRTPEERVKTFERILKSVVPGAELVKCEIQPKDLRETWEPLRVKLSARLPEMVVKGETLSELTLPSLSASLGIVNWLLAGSTSLEKRRYPLVLDTTACVRERLSVDVGGALGPLSYLPADGRTTNGYDYVRTICLTNGTLTMNRSLAVDRVEFDPAAYSALREEIKRVEAAERLKPIFATDVTADANVRRWLDSSETTIVSDNEWVTTNEVVTEVLTYKGKKDVAEMKFDWHPSWKRVELVSAVVSNRDGRVMRVSPKEMNVLDADWASAAPRYPAGKILVVNLPSVEIGSIVSVKTVVTVTNAPAPFYSCVYLDSHQPVDRLVRRLGDFRFDGKPRRLADEPAQPSGRLWRKHQVVFRGDWKKAAENLSRACEIRPLRPSTFNLQPSTLREARDWMAKYVKLVGPSLYELPLEEQLTDPEIVLKERYATRLDYVRTLCALLRGADFEADVVFAANNAKSPTALREADRCVQPNVRAYAVALCRVRVREGGFFGFGGETKEFFLGTENEYTPIGSTAYDGSDYFDPQAVAFGVVRNVGEEYAAKDVEWSEFVIRENGSVDLMVSNLCYGAGVGAFRKRFAEILPEMRSRLYQSILGGLAQAATATSELETDVVGYPALTKFSCFIPDYATACTNAMTIVLPPFEEVFPTLTGSVRETPLAIGVSDPKLECVVVRFPKGYTVPEHLPESFVLREPRTGEVWLKMAVSTEIRDGALVVKIERLSRVPSSTLLGAEYADLIKDWRRRCSSRVNSTITATRPLPR